MKLTTIIAFFITTFSFSQQIGNGMATLITDFSAPLGSGIYNGYSAIGANSDPAPIGDWQHLFVSRHPNNANNYQLQISSSIAQNDKLYFRKLASGSPTPINPEWFEIATRGTNNFTGNQGINGNLEINEKTDSRPLGQSAATKSVLKLSRNGTLNHSYNENAEFRIGHGGNSIYGSKLELYINGSTNTNSIPDQQVMTWNYNGNVGIGITNPTNKLDVNGTIHSKEVKVDMNGWSDFVFKKEYSLPTLAEVEKHITEKGYLENIPSEEEVLKNGINLGEMNSKLLQKIEELTLYIIEQDKKITDLKNLNENFKVVFERLSEIEEKLN